jgi:hypothetical protein
MRGGHRTGLLRLGLMMAPPALILTIATAVLGFCTWPNSSRGIRSGQIRPQLIRNCLTE